MTFNNKSLTAIQEVLLHILTFTDRICGYIKNVWDNKMPFIL